MNFRIKHQIASNATQEIAGILGFQRLAARKKDRPFRLLIVPLAALVQGYGQETAPQAPFFSDVEVVAVVSRRLYCFDHENFSKIDKAYMPYAVIYDRIYN